MVSRGAVAESTWVKGRGPRARSLSYLMAQMLGCEVENEAHVSVVYRIEGRLSLLAARHDVVHAQEA
jgi:hypothetical protein